MEVLWIALAFGLGVLASRVGLPPLIGFLGGGFVLAAFGVQDSGLLHTLSHYGIIFLLFTLGLEMRLKNVARLEVYGTGLVQIVLSVGLLGLAFLVFGLSGTLGWAGVLLLALLLSDMSTVIAAKGLQERQELSSYQGRVAIGITVFDDVVMITILALVGLGAPSPWALLLLGLPLLRRPLWRLLDTRVQGELLLLYGVMLALGGSALFELVGLGGELGAFAFGILVAGHPQADELAESLWGLREAFLVGFFLEIGLGGLPNLAGVGLALALVLYLPIRVVIFFLLLVGFRLRARTAFFTGATLASYSEFALIAGALVIQAGLLPETLLPILALTVALSFAFGAPFNRLAYPLYGRLERHLTRFERNVKHPDENPVSVGRARYLVVGMGRAGTAAYDDLRKRGEAVLGMDSDPGKLEQQRKAGRRVVYGDADDLQMWQEMRLGRLEGVILTVPDLTNKLRATRALRSRNFAGKIIATRSSGLEYTPLEEAGADSICNPLTEAGVRMAALVQPDPTPTAVAADD